MEYNSVNPLYLLINRVYVHVSEKNSNKFLTIDKGDIKVVDINLFYFLNHYKSKPLLLV